MLEFSIYIFVISVLLKNLTALYNIVLSRRAIHTKLKINNLGKKRSMRNVLILIPVLSEQAAIRETMDHFKKFNTNEVALHIAIAGTKREPEVDEKLSTKDIVQDWIKEFENTKSSKQCLSYHFFEADDPNGDRATQLNFAVDAFNKKFKTGVDLIGVYDADSLPSINTFDQVINDFETDDILAACQQPVHFVDASNEMAINRKNPILIANAIYQSTWSIIKELPMWLKYYKHSLKTDSIHMRNVYLIGHGQFLKTEIYTMFRFPEQEVTDGIQLGYRLAMSKKKIKPLLEFCSDDVPRSFNQLVQQHKRWFGGCMRLKNAYFWSKQNFNTRALCQVIDGIWSQSCWAWASLFSIVFLVIGYCYNFYIFIILMTLTLNYCYVIPVLAHQVLPVKIKVRLIDWLCLPIAIASKAIGPNLFFWETLHRAILKKESIKYQKVDRDIL